MQNVSSPTAPATTGGNTITENDVDLVLSIDGTPALPSLWIQGARVFRRDGEVFSEISLKESARLAAESWAAVEAEERFQVEGEAFPEWLAILSENLP